MSIHHTSKAEEVSQGHLGLPSLEAVASFQFYSQLAARPATVGRGIEEQKHPRVTNTDPLGVSLRRPDYSIAS